MAPRTSRAAGVRTARRTTVAQTFDALTVEGALIATAQLALVAGAQAEGQDETAYSVPRGLTLRDEIPRYFRIAQALWKDLAASDTTSTAATVEFVERLMRDVLGFVDVTRAPVRAHDGRTHPVTLEALGGRVPVVVASPSDPLDRPSSALSIDGRRTSAALALQDWLNAAEGTLWGLACNGEKLRLVRDNPSLTRPAYIEADLRRMFEGDAFADFTALWLLLHASRFGFAGTPVTDCTLERWRDAGQKAGVAARDRLRDGVEEALRAFGTGFLSHPANGELRRKLEVNELDLLDFHGLLLRLVYRLIFLLAAEDRNLLHPPAAPVAARTLYAEGYSLSRLRARSAKRAAWDAHDDLWDGLQIAFLSLARGEPSLALPALAGLFIHGGLGELETCALPNRALMRAIYRLAWLKDGGAVVPVNWRDMETEELGSVYESLLELTPRLTDNGRAYGFAEGTETRGNQRKTTGSYYTPDSLVQVLLDSALDPVLDRAERESETPADALLAIQVIDPACGSGHFLLAAARRIATRVARHRAGGAASADDYRHALRDVARSCIHGVDRNPMAVELTKVALWIETVEPGKPLGFLDANIRCGDALLGVFDLGALNDGIPDAAYKPLAGDDAQAARIAGRVNRDQKLNIRQSDLVAGLATRNLAREAQAVLAMAEEDVSGLKRKAEAYAALRSNVSWEASKLACDLYVAAFLRQKVFRKDSFARSQNPDRVPTTLDVLTAIGGRQPDPELVGLAVEIAGEARAFHWPLEFPAAMAAGGFDVVLGNPPWEVMQLGEEEYFSQRVPEIAELAGAARKQAIAALATEWPDVFTIYQRDKRRFEAGNEFARSSDRFKLTARGKINTYGLFAELFTSLTSPAGRAGLIVPTGIATDATTAPFFAALTNEKRLASLFDFENSAPIFTSVHRSFKFCLLTSGRNIDEAAFAFFLTDPAQLAEPERRFTLSPSQISRINPNTKTAPIFRSRRDAELTASIYGRVPVLVDEADEIAGDPWGIQFRQGLFNMASDSALFRTAAQLEAEGLARDGIDWQGALAGDRWVPLYESKMLDQYNHRYADYSSRGDSRGHRVLPQIPQSELHNNSREAEPFYWVLAKDVDSRAQRTPYLSGYGEATTASTYRTFVATIFPWSGVGHKTILYRTSRSYELENCLTANFNSIVLDYLTRTKVSYLTLAQFIVKQLPIIPPQDYTPESINFISSRVLELTYTSWGLKQYALALGYDGPPFAWDEGRRAVLQSELDAWYARAYGLTRDELRYILAPADVMGSSYPSETFRILKDEEVRAHGEYRTQRLVLEAWDAQGNTLQTPVAATPAVEVRSHPSTRQSDDWARPAADIGSLAMQTRAQIAAVLKALPGPMPEQRVRLAALFALEPNLLTARLSGAERGDWIRAVGGEATPTSPGVLTFGLGGAAGWAIALRQLMAQNALIIDTANNTWAAGPGLTSYFTDGWPERAGFALDVAARVLTDQTTTLTGDESRGIAAIAA